MSDSSASHAADDTAAPPELVARAEELVRKHPAWFWFRHPDSRIETVADIRVVIRRLRQTGDRDAWEMAQSLTRCL